jgi:tRNA G18 (ribose-2'-O)-methylase SpoU
VLIPISDPSDPRLSAYANVPDPELLKSRGVFVAEGRLVVARLLEAGRFQVQSVLVTGSALEAMRDRLEQVAAPVYVVPQAVMNGVTGFNIHRGCLAIADRGSPRTPAVLLAAASRVVVLERVANADNVGALFRNAAAFGVDAVLLDPASTDPLYRKAIRTSMGAALSVPFARLEPWPDALQQLRENGFVLLGLVTTPDAPPIRTLAHALRGSRTALLLGHEGDGLTPAARASCSQLARIPMRPDVDSLNVATAAAIALYECSG